MHIYRLVCEGTVEENILRKSVQKRQLDWMAIQARPDASRAARVGAQPDPGQVSAARGSAAAGRAT